MRLTSHAQRQLQSRNISEAVVQEALDNPVVQGHHSNRTQWNLTRAVLDGAWRFVMVFWKDVANTKLVITAYPIEGRKFLGNAFTIGLWS